MKSRVLIFSLAYSPFIGGAELAVEEITERIGDFEFDLITLRMDKNLPRRERIGNVEVYRIGPAKTNPRPDELVSFPLYLTKVWYPVGAFLAARRLVRHRSYAFSWAIMSYAGFPALFLKMFRGVPFLLTLQEGDSVKTITGRWRIRIILPLYKRIFREAALVQAISRYLADFARDMGACAPIHVIPNGVRDTFFANAGAYAAARRVREKLGIRESDRIALTVSRLVRKNGVDIVIDALRALPREVKLLVVGEGPEHDILRRRAEEQEVEGRIFFAGAISQDDLPLYYALASLFIRTSRSEGLGSVFLEAMAAGLPVIGTRVGGIPDIVKDGETGWLVPPEDVRAAAEAMIFVLDPGNRDTVREVARQGQNMVKSEYIWETIAERMRSCMRTCHEREKESM